MASPLGYKYRWKIGVGLEAALAEECLTYVGDHDFLWRASRVPSIQLAASVPGELEAIIEARDAAVTEAMETENVATN